MDDFPGETCNRGPILVAAGSGGSHSFRKRKKTQSLLTSVATKSRRVCQRLEFRCVAQGREPRIGGQGGADIGCLGICASAVWRSDRGHFLSVLIASGFCFKVACEAARSYHASGESGARCVSFSKAVCNFCGWFNLLYASATDITIGNVAFGFARTPSSTWYARSFWPIWISFCARSNCFRKSVELGFNSASSFVMSDSICPDCHCAGCADCLGC